MSTVNTVLKEAKLRLDRLIGKSRAHFYKPIGVAETLYHNRIDELIDLSELDQYRRRSYDWCRDVSEILYDRRPDLNSRYWDQLFDPAVMPPEHISALGAENCRHGGIVETYIYGNALNKLSGISEILNFVDACTPDTFDFSAFLSKFEDDKRFRRSIDKAYEIVVYALFSGITQYANATVSISVDPQSEVLRDFEDFAKIVLGVDVENPEIKQYASLYRVGTANAADAGLDMWANFGPAVQVKHLSLSPDKVNDVCGRTEADKIVIVCKSVEAPSIESMLNQLGLSDRVRGIITELDLIRWYKLACGEKYSKTLGKYLLKAINREIMHEFPLTEGKRVDNFIEQRGYDLSMLSGFWALK